jgi:hypothetical protein
VAVRRAGENRLECRTYPVSTPHGTILVTAFIATASPDGDGGGGADQKEASKLEEGEIANGEIMGYQLAVKGKTADAPPAASVLVAGDAAAAGDGSGVGGGINRGAAGTAAAAWLDILTTHPAAAEEQQAVEVIAAAAAAVMTTTEAAGAAGGEVGEDVVMGETRPGDPANGMRQFNTLQIGTLESQGGEFARRAGVVLAAHLGTTGGMEDDHTALGEWLETEPWEGLASKLGRTLVVVGQVTGKEGVMIETYVGKAKGGALPPLYFLEDQHQPARCRRLQHRVGAEDQRAADPFTRHLRNGQVAGQLKKIELGEWRNRRGTGSGDCKCTGREEEEIGRQATQHTQDIKMDGPHLAEAIIGADHVVMIHGPEKALTFRIHTTPPAGDQTICPHHQWVVYLGWTTEGERQAGAGDGGRGETGTQPSMTANGDVVDAAGTGREEGAVMPPLPTSNPLPPFSSEASAIQVLLVTHYGRKRRGKWIQGPVVTNAERPRSAEVRRASAKDHEGGGGHHACWLNLSPEVIEQTQRDLATMASMVSEEGEGGARDDQRRPQHETLLRKMAADSRAAALTCLEHGWGSDMTAALFLRRDSQDKGWHVKATLGPQQMSFITKDGVDKRDWTTPPGPSDRLCPNQWQTVDWDQELLVVMVKPSPGHWITMGLYRCTKEVLIWDSIEGPRGLTGALHWTNAIIRLAGEMGHGEAWGAPNKWHRTRMDGPYQKDASSCAFFGIGTVVALLTNQDIEHSAANIHLLRLAVAGSIIDHGNHQGRWP